jgi:penicillin-insensitive murein endopeptidase
MGLLAAALSALAGAGATSWWDSVPEEESAPALASDLELELPDDAEDAEDRPWLGRRAPPDVDVVHPLAALDDLELEELALRDPEALGSMSVGLPNRGALVNPIQLPDSPFWQKMDPDHAWGTRETIEFVQHAITRVNDDFPATRALYVGDFSGRGGGRLRPHKSHQSGRDVDLGYYYSNDAVWYTRANAANLDRARTWALLSTLITETRVEYVFMDKGIQPLLHEYALAQGVDPEWLSRVFDGSPGKRDAIVRHRWGHATHFHVRFENPTAEQTARRSYHLLRQARLASASKSAHPQRRRRR